MAAFVVLDGLLAITPGWDGVDCALVAQGGPEPIRVVAAVGDQPLHALGLADEQVGTFNFRGIARRQEEAERPAEEVDDAMDLPRPAAARDANGLGANSSFSPPEHWCVVSDVACPPCGS